MMRRLAIAVAVVLTPFVLGACGGTPGTSGGNSSASDKVSTDISGSGPVTLTVWTPEGSKRQEIMEKLGKSFMAKYPDVTIRWVKRDFGAYPAQLKLALAGDKSPDLAVGNIGWSLDGALIKAGLIRDLTPYADAYGWQKRYSETGLRQLKFTTDGKTFGSGPIWGVPYAADVIGWFYNVEKLKALGVGVPKTFAELEADLKKAKAAGEIPFVLGNKDGWPALHVYFTINDNIASPEQVTGIVYGDPKVKWTDQPFVDSAQKLVDWVNAYANPQPNGVAPDDAAALFIKGKAVFFPAGSWNAPGLSETMKDNVGFFVTPPNEAGGKSYATGSYGWCLHVSSKAKNPDVAAAFLDWISNEAAATEFFKSGDIAPVLADNPPLKPGKLTSDIYNAWTSVLKNDALLSYLDFATPSAGEIEYPTFQSIIGGKVTPAEGLATIQAAREKFLGSQK